MTSLPEVFDLRDEWVHFLKVYSPGETRAPAPAKEAAKAAAIDAPPVAEIDPASFALNISTKTKILYLDRELDIHAAFWGIPVLEYWCPENGVVKKQMKFVSHVAEEVADIAERLEAAEYSAVHIIRQINNPDARSVKFKDERKVTIGMSKKDVMCCRGKQKNAFYNCFAMVLRIMFNGAFREVHVKVFKTGKLEIPGVADDALLALARDAVTATLAPIAGAALAYDAARPDTDVLINSNFNCGYYIDRDAANLLLRSPEYDIEAVYDPCSYPGIKCKFYFDTRIGFDAGEQTGRISVEDRSLKVSELNRAKTYIEISFMIFRTGSVLIVGNCSERVLRVVFGFIARFLAREQASIQGASAQAFVQKPVRVARVHRKVIGVTVPAVAAAIADR
jgi:hypothetical protein